MLLKVKSYILKMMKNLKMLEKSMLQLQEQQKLLSSRIPKTMSLYSIAKIEITISMILKI